MKQIVYISFVRFPSEKAHAIYINKHCESLVKRGYKVALLVPRRLNKVYFTTCKEDNCTYHFSVVRLPTIDLLILPFGKAFFHRLGVIIFGIGSLLYALVHKHRHYITNEFLVALLLSFVPIDLTYEVHDYPKNTGWLYRWVFVRVSRIQTNNHQKVTRLIRDFKLSPKKVYAVHNGVTISDFDIKITQKEARERLQLKLNEKYIVYTGHLYRWKGVDVLARAALHLPEATVLFVGGTDLDIVRMRQTYQEIQNIIFYGHKPHSQIPLFLKAADVLVLPNTAKEEISALHTSPMKVFEYMASKRPIVASDIPSIREVLNNANATLVPADEPELLARALRHTLAQVPTEKVQQAFEDVRMYTWKKRVKKVTKYLENGME